MSDNRKFYSVDGQQFRFYSDALSVAILSRSNIIDLTTGLVRWSPAVADPAKQKQYQERLNAYNAQQKAKQ